MGCGVKDWIIQDEDGRWCGYCIPRETADALWIAIDASKKKEHVFKLQTYEQCMEQDGKEDGKDK